MPESAAARWRERLPGLPVLQGLLPGLTRSRAGPDLIAGVTLAALGIPEVMGYAKIAGMPLVTGLYTMLLPMAVFAFLGSSRHLVVAADSATAAILAAGLAGMAAAGSERYVRLAGLAALLAGAMLLLARLVRLGFLANFLSRTVLVGFLTGVGVGVAAGQLPAMLGVKAAGRQTVPLLVHTVRALPGTHGADVAVSAGVIVIVVAARRVSRRIPGALIAVVIAIGVSRAAHLARHGVAVVGPVPRGVPSLGLPAFGLHAATALLSPAASMFVVILAQSTATSRAYAAKYEEPTDEDADLAALGAANAVAAFSGTFVVNGSPTKAEMVDSAGGRSQLAPLAASAVVLAVVLLLTGPLAYLPEAALAAVVFVIGVGLVDISGMRQLRAVRPNEFIVALLATAAVIGLGVEYGIVLAVLASIVDHLRHSYNPVNSVLLRSAAGHWKFAGVTPGARTEAGLVVYRFGTSLYYANAARLLADIAALAGHGGPLRWLVFDCAAIDDIDYTASAVLARAVEYVHQRHLRFVVSAVLPPVRQQLDSYRIRPDAYYDTAGEAFEAFHASEPAGSLPAGTQAVQHLGQRPVVDDGQPVRGPGDRDVQVVAAGRGLGEYSGRVGEHHPVEFQALGLGHGEQRGR
ncbi:MAG: SulP family inorganic anion transporter [Streptosporangiaceae bacterium]|nr:SulP family inorganic anion transporter [Streptosporangiaceae bacterium]